MHRVSVYIDNSNVFKNIKSIRLNGDRSWTQLYDPLKLAVYFYCVPPPAWLLSEGEESKQRHITASKYYSAILVSNDGDYLSAVTNTKKLGKRVELLFFRGYLSGALRKSCDLTRRARKVYFEPLAI